MHKFIFKSYKYSQNGHDLDVSYHFEILKEDIHHKFEHKLSFKNVFEENLTTVNSAKQIENEIELYIANLGLAEALSYWKLTAAPLFEVQALNLDQKQVEFWHKLLIKGMGEYFYINQIKFNDPDFVKIYSSNQSELNQNTKTHTREDAVVYNDKKIMVPVGGGKDSVVTIELIKQFGLTPQFYMLNPIDSAKATIAKSGFTDEKDQSIVTRTFDPLLFDLNKQGGYLNGHVPISATIAFSSILTAKLKNIEYVAISNERSSNEGNVFYCDQEINHQYSKTFEFESDFRDYVINYVDKNSPSYFSILRPLFEIQIAKIFAEKNQYHDVFRSCNRGQKTNSWCGECPKCMFAYVILSPFIANDRLNEIFGKNLFAHLELYPLIEELTGISPNKPFECVGTREETLIALYLAAKNLQNLNLPLLDKISKEILDKEKDLENRSSKLLTAWNQENFLPKTYSDQLEKILENNDKAILIFGFGREGQASLDYIKNNPTLFSTNKIFVYDDRQLDLNIKNANIISQKQIDELPNELLVIKTAGVKPTHQFLQTLQQKKNVKLTTNTNLFFERIKKDFPEIITIGITGTKGKSTTSSLIYHVLKENKLDVFFGGNIGKPPTDLIKEIEDFYQTKNQGKNKNKVVVVLELSCHQLSDIKYSPDIAVLQDISPEHLDYYETFEQYQDAKINITRYQNSQNILITSPEYSHYSISSTASPAQKENFDLSTLKHRDFASIDLSKIKLVGQHNLYNLIPSILIAKKFAIENEKIQQALESFKPLPHRLELAANRDGVLYINDSLSTTPKATIAAIESFADKNLILILGGHDRHLQFDELADVILAHKVKLILYFNPTGMQIVEALEKNVADKKIPPTQLVTSMQEAVELAKSVAKSGDVVLMSPASASFGIFKDYEDRGNQFKQFVEN